MASVPTECPSCGKTLYSSARLRPEPRLSMLGMMIMAVGVLVSALVFVGGGIVIRSVGEAHGIGIPGKVLGPVMLIPAVLPGIAIGLVAHRMPKVRTVRCWSCKWTARFAGNVAWSSPRETRGASAPLATSAAATVSSSTFDQIVADDADPWKEVVAWAYAEIRGGRTPEDVCAELVGGGWAADEVETVVERCRKEARYAPGVVRAIRQAEIRRGPEPISAPDVLPGSAALIARDQMKSKKPNRRAAQGRCLQCGYDLAGNVSGVCPECGTRFGHAAAS